MAERSVTLRGYRDERNSQHEWATLSADGTLRIQGQDLGDNVERIFGPGNSEYEWAQTIRPQDVAKLVAALDSGDDVLAALAKRFSDDPGFLMQRFLDEHGIRYESWSRVGD